MRVLRESGKPCSIRWLIAGYATAAFARQVLQDAAILEFDGARGRDRTTDTAIFSRMLYQLSYPGIAAATA